jgi:hypothetical protein
MQQLSLSFIYDEDLLRSYLEKAADKSVSLVITDNSYSILSLKEEKDSVRLRLHRIFLAAGSDIRDEIAAFIRNSSISTPLIRGFIDQNTQRLNRNLNYSAKCRHQGKHHNLMDVFSSLNREYFQGRVTASITWGSKGARRRARRRTLGSYSYDRNIIRINPVLDSTRYPKYYLEYVIYHEMLHADICVDGKSKRRSYHSRTFREREGLFRHYDKVLNLERGQGVQDSRVQVSKTDKQ